MELSLVRNLTMTTAIIKLSTLRDLAASASVRSVAIVGERGGWTVSVRHGRAERILAGKNGEPRRFAKLDTAAKQLLDLGLSTFEVKGAHYQTAALRPGRPDRAAAMKAANAYGRWLKAEVAHTAARVANGEATLFTQAQAEARGAAKRAELQRRRKTTD